jgi:flagellar basal-body rod protein FlgF
METLDLLANNLANINTTGFKEQRAFYRLLDRTAAWGETSPLSAVVNNHAALAEAAYNFENGSLVETGRDLDIALVGPGFLSIQTPNGVRYSRNGNLQTNARSQLVTIDGLPVLGERGPIVLGQGKTEINEHGEVVVDKAIVERLKLVTFEASSQLQREGNTLFAPRTTAEAKPAEGVTVRQGYLEQSNVSPVASTVRMVEIMRHFEAIQKSLNLISNVMDAKSIEKLSR